jgi:hypothetical protein
MTIKQRALVFVCDHPGSSAYQVAVAIGEKWGTVSSCLYREMRAGRIRRKNGLGPRGGYGYFVEVIRC